VLAVKLAMSKPKMIKLILLIFFRTRNINKIKIAIAPKKAIIGIVNTKNSAGKKADPIMARATPRLAPALIPNKSGPARGL